MLNALFGDEFRYEIYLCKPFSSLVATIPVYETIGCLSSCAYNLNIKTQMQNINECDFEIALYWNDIDNTENIYFDLTSAGKMIRLESYIDTTLQKTEYFYIYQTDVQGVEKEVKNVKCYSAQYKWNKIKIRNFKTSDTFVTTRKLYDGQTFDADDAQVGGMLDYILQVKLHNTWKVSYMSSSLEDRYRTFDISEQSLMEVIHTIESMFNCVFFFDTYLNSIRIVAYDELPSETGLIISDKNYLKKLSQQIKVDEIVTRLYPEGKSEISGVSSLSISGVNITGQSYIDNFDYFRTTAYMSTSLLSALTTYDGVLTANAGTFSGLLAVLAIKQAELAVLQDDLYDLNTDLLVLQNNETACIKTGGLVGGQNYSYWHSAVIAKEAEITAKEGDITSKEAEIIATNASIASVVNTVSYENNFTTTQLQELLQFINEETIKCDTSDIDELYSFGVEMLAIKASPPIDFSLDLVDIFSTQDANYAWDKLTLGSLVDLEFEDFSISAKPRIVAYTHNPDSNSLSVTVSNLTFYNDALDYLNTILAFSRQAATTSSNERDIYSEYVDDKSTIIFDTDTIDSSTNEIQNEDGTLILDRRGLFMKRIDDADGQFRIFEDRILATNDNWITYSVAITSNGIQCDDLWVLTNTDGSVRITGDTIEISDMELDMYANSGNNRIQINPAEGIQFSIDATPVFYTDTDGSIYAKDLYLSSNTTNGQILINPDIGIEISKTDSATPLLFADTEGDLYLQNVYLGNNDGSVSISPTGIEIKNTDGVTTILDEYGIDPRFLDYSKNMIYNSSFECFDQITKVPVYWSLGESSASSSFNGTYSLKLTAGQVCLQSGTSIDPAWWGSTVARVSFYRKFGEVTIKIKDITNSTYFTLTDEDGNTGTQIDYARTTLWVDTRVSVTFDPLESGHATCTNCAVEFTNSHVSEACYIDAVQMTPDFTGKWSQLYKNGQYSVGVNDIGDYSPSVATFG